jgi:hypothetical protein
MSDVWVVRCPNGKVIGASTFNDRAIKEAQSGTINMDSRKALNEAWNLYWDDGGEAGTYSCDPFTLTRETLLAPAHAAVIEAAKAIRDVPFTYQFGSEHWIQAFDKLDIAVTALRALEGDA